MRTVFLGTSEFAVGVLESLLSSPHRPLLVITRPDRPKGRGRRVQAPPVACCAKANQVALAQPQKVNSEETIERISALEPDAIVVCAFGALIREPLLSLRPMLNIHPSLLPRWRGAAPIERAIIAGDAVSGVSIMRLTEGLDSGPVCLAEQLQIGEHEDYGALSRRLCVLAAALIARALDRLEHGPPLYWQDQDEAEATYAEKIVAADRLLDPVRDARELERIVRALHPHIGARIALPGGESLRVMRARALASGPPPGVLQEREGHLLYGAGSGALELLVVQPAGGRPMDAEAYLRGHPL